MTFQDKLSVAPVFASTLASATFAHYHLRFCFVGMTFCLSRLRRYTRA